MLRGSCACSAGERALWGSCVWAGFKRQPDIQPRTDQYVELLKLYAACNHVFDVHALEDEIERYRTGAVRAAVSAEKAAAVLARRHVQQA